ncbi:hypothetical protein B0H16DRAFT_1715925 [Mycena metata]|uniref:DUF6532 domain-containing protein n=1 Tax=Mycena metata TaxID=1033252 RepID=A0AAD7JPW8_9AGAR|nr:hypothetical protein B0H16DRAFT_1715925 [Mycena metata]
MAAQSTLKKSNAASNSQPRRNEVLANRHDEDKENEQFIPRQKSISKSARLQMYVEEHDDEDLDHDYRPDQSPVDNDDEEDALGDEMNDEDEDDVDAAPRGRARRPSDKQAQHDQEKADKAARKRDKVAKADKAAKKKAGVIEEDTRSPIRDNFFTTRTVPFTRPTAAKHLAQRNSKVPPPPKFPNDQWYATDHSDRRGEGSSRRRSRSRSPEQGIHTFRGRSPAREQVPFRGPICNINGGVVPDSVQLNLRDDIPHEYHGLGRRPHGRSPHRGRSPVPDPRPNREPILHRPRRLSREAHSSPSRSSSPSVGNKRGRSPSGDSDDLRSTQSQRTSSSGGRPRAKDLDERTKEYTTIAIDYYRCGISTQEPFPLGGAVESGMVRRAWNAACEEMGEGMILTPTVFKLIASRGPQLRGELKTKAKAIVALTCGFQTGQNKKTIAFNRKRAEYLKEDSTFAFKDVDAKTGLYKNPLFQMIINAMWFANRRDEGPRHPDLFNPFPKEAFALVLAVTENNIDEYLTGIRTDVPFTANDYRAVYEGHLKSLEEFAVHTQEVKLLDKILKRIHSVGRFHSGAQPISAVTAPTFSKQILDAAIKEAQEGSTTDDDSE